MIDIDSTQININCLFHKPICCTYDAISKKIQSTIKVLVKSLCSSKITNLEILRKQLKLAQNRYDKLEQNLLSTIAHYEKENLECPAKILAMRVKIEEMGKKIDRIQRKIMLSSASYRAIR
jgi:hypothetical protein